MDVSSLIDAVRATTTFEVIAFVVVLAAMVKVTNSIIGTVWSFLGRRVSHAHLLRSLASGVTSDYFRERLGAPALERSHGGLRRLTWVFPLTYIHAVVDDGTVQAFAVTIRARFFWPRLGSGLGSAPPVVRLGRSSFADISDEPGEIAGIWGARRFGYSEQFYFGNPGMYRTFAYGWNDAGVYSDAYELAHSAATGTRPPEGSRRGSRPNTYAVSAPHVALREMMDSQSPGVDLDEVRVVDEHLRSSRRLRVRWNRYQVEWRIRRQAGQLIKASTSPVGGKAGQLA